MQVKKITSKHWFGFLLIALSALFSSNEVLAAQLNLSWTDNSTNETGFTIDRKTGAAGTYAQLNSVGAGVTTYMDTTATAGTNYCYRVHAFNSAGDSPDTPEVCGSAAIQTFALSITKAGAGSGTVTSSPAGINCGATCAGSYNSGVVVALTATAAPGSVFAGWTGAGCGATGSVTLSANRACTATFNLPPPATFTLSVARAGAGSGTVTSSPAGINCGTTCAGSYNSGVVVALTATAAPGSVFAGWTGAGCGATGSVTLSANRACTATFNLPLPATFTLSVAKTGAGSGTVTSSPAGINCGSTCTGSYSSGATVALTAAAATNSTFVGWTGSGCSATSATINVNLSASRSCTATFDSQATTNPLMAKIGVFRPSTGEWFLDLNGNGIFDGCTVDSCVTGYGSNAMLPIVGDWEGTGRTSIGTFEPKTGTWHLDNGNGKWDACSSTGDICVMTYGSAGSLPVVKALSSEKLVVGTFQGTVTTGVGRRKATKRGVWNFDLDGDGNVDRCGTDQCIENFGQAGDLPITGDWNGTGGEEIGVFRPATAQWYLDLNGNGRWDSGDKVMGPFGLSTDLPIVGDWDGTGKVRIGTYRPSTGQWFFDINGNGKWDNCTTDACLGPFGQAGDLPVAGQW